MLSESVSDALMLTGGKGAIETSKFVSIFDKFFDLLNVRNFTSGTRKRKPFQHPYRHADDFRLHVRNERLHNSYRITIILYCACIVAGRSISSLP